MSTLLTPTEKTAILKEALNKIAWSSWHNGDSEFAAREHIKIAVKALKDADELPRRPIP